MTVETLLIAGFTFVVLGLAIGFFRSLSLIPALHAMTFILMTTAFEVASLMVEPRRYQLDILLLVLTLLGLYLFFILFDVPVFRHLAGGTDEFLRAILGMSPTGLWLLMTIGLGIKAYLLVKYGVIAFALLSTPDTSVTSVDTTINTLMMYPATGAFWATSILLACVPRMVLHRPMLFITWTLFFLWPLLGFGELGGGRRFIMITVMLAGLAAWAHRGCRVSPRAIISVAAVSTATFSLLIFFQAIRTNLGPETIAMLNSRDLGLMTTAVIQYLTPPADVGGIFERNLRERFSPFSVLYDLTDQQIQRLEGGGQVLANGTIVAQAFYNVVPRAALATKETVNADELLARLFDFPNIDLPAGLVAFAQAELFAFAYVVTPLVTLLLLGLYARWFRRCAGRNLILQASVLSVLVLTSTYVEAVADSLLADARHLLVIAVLVLPAHSILRFLREAHKTADLTVSSSR